MRMFGVLVALVVGYLLFGSVVLGSSGFGIYLKRSPMVCPVACKLRPTEHVERLILDFNDKFVLLVVGYNHNGIRGFERMPALP